MAAVPVGAATLESRFFPECMPMPGALTLLMFSVILRYCTSDAYSSATNAPASAKFMPAGTMAAKAPDAPCVKVLPGTALLAD